MSFTRRLASRVPGEQLCRGCRSGALGPSRLGAPWQFLAAITADHLNKRPSMVTLHRNGHSDHFGAAAVEVSSLASDQALAHLTVLRQVDAGPRHRQGAIREGFIGVGCDAVR